MGRSPASEPPYHRDQGSDDDVEDGEEQRVRLETQVQEEVTEWERMR